MNEYLQYFKVTESFIKEYSPFNFFSLVNTTELIYTYDGPLQDEKALEEIIEAYKWLLTSHGIPEGQHLNEVIYFASIVEHYARSIEFEAARRKKIKDRKTLMEALIGFPLALKRQSGKIWIAEPSEEDIANIISIPEDKFNDHDPIMRAKAFYHNFYFSRESGQKLKKPNHKELEISRSIKITIASKIDPAKKAIVTDIELTEKIIATIIESLVPYEKANAAQDAKTVNGNLQGKVICFISNLILKYLNDNALLPNKGNPLFPMLKVNSCLTSLLSSVGLKKKPLIQEIYSTVAPLEQNQYIRQCRRYRRLYTISKNAEGEYVQNKSSANYIRKTLLDKSL